MSNPLASDLNALRQVVEKSARHGRYAQTFHLVPPVGWLNDPNGLCQLGDTYHAFFQYSPFSAEGGVKMWGHSTSSDMVRWSYEGTALYPDQPVDVGGVYSGSAYVEDGVMHVFYTGNVKHEDEDGYDYVNTGREANTIYVISTDGVNFGPKKLVMGNADYPGDDTEHVRDPKVWRDGDTYYMVQGARKKDDTGEVLVFSSPNLVNWELCNRITSNTRFGYMWECPDYFELPDTGEFARHEVVQVLSVSPQGLHGGDWDRRNVYQSGYFVLLGDVTSICTLFPFALWDAGFDFYAPQTFQTDDGRRILIGWMGMPDEKSYTNLTVRDGWQHCFTVPREVSAKNGRVLQWPVRELESYRTNEQRVSDTLVAKDMRAFDLLVDGIDANEPLTIVLANQLELTWRDRRFEMRFTDEDMESVGAGRKSRFEFLDELRNVRVVCDVSSVEVFVNDGELTFSSRYYPVAYGIDVMAPGAEISLWDLEAEA